MSIPSQDVYLNLTKPLSVVGSGGSSGVDAIVSGANISTLGASVGDVTVALQPNLANINSVAFSAGGAVTGLSTINGAPVGVASLPANPAFSTITFDAGGAITGLSTINGAPVGVASVPANPAFSTITFDAGGAITGLSTINGAPVGVATLPADPSFSSITFNTGSSITNIFASTLNGDPSIFFQSGTSSLQGQFLIKSAGSQGGFTGMGYGPTSNAFQSAVTIGVNGIDLDAGTGNKVSFTADETVIDGGLFSVPGLSGASISTLRADTLNGTSAALSTLALSTIGAIVAASAGNVQTFNTVIGNIRLQGGVVSTTSAGVAVSWTAFSTVPIILTGCTGTTGAGTTVVLQGGGESGVNISVNTGTTTEVYWLAIGAV